MKQVTTSSRSCYLLGLLLCGGAAQASEVFVTAGHGEEKAFYGVGANLMFGELEGWGLTLDFNRFDGLKGDALSIPFVKPVDTMGLSLDKNWHLGDNWRITLGAGAQFSLSELTLNYYDGTQNILLDKYDAIPSADFRVRYRMTDNWNLQAGARYLFATSPIDGQYGAYLGLGYRFGGSSAATTATVAPQSVSAEPIFINPRDESGTKKPQHKEVVAEGVLPTKEDVPELQVETKEALVSMKESAMVTSPALDYCLQTGAFKNSGYLVRQMAKVSALYPNVRLSDRNPLPTLYLAFVSKDERKDAILRLNSEGVETFSIPCHHLE